MNNQINTKTLKARLKLSDYEKLFKALNIPIYSKGDKYWKLYTGCHNKDPYSGSPKLLFYPETGLCQCLTQCNCTTDIIGLVQRRLGVLGKPSSFMDSVNIILESTEMDLSDIRRINTKKYEYNWEKDLGKFIRFRRTGSELPEYDKSILNCLNISLPQDWIDEGISVETLQKYNIGYYERLCQTTIPCFDKDGRLIGIRVRNWNPERAETAKYMPLYLADNTCYKFNTNDVFYGINYNWANIENTQTVILVEGEKSVLKADTWFGENSNVLALYGSQIGTKRRNQLIKMGVKKVILALDSDFYIGNDTDMCYTKFVEKITKLGMLFKNYCEVEVIYNNIGLDGYKCSPFDFDLETYKKLYENRVPFDFYSEEYTKMKR